MKANKYELSILIPARNEMFIAETVKQLLQQIRGKTEIIVVLDGQWAYPEIEDDSRVTIIYVPESIGQREATNQAARLSKAKYVMKLDAHCVFDEGFDVKMMDDMQENWTMVPVQYNLHGFDWVCIGKYSRSGEPYEPEEWFRTRQGCGHKKYQSPTPKSCDKCGGNMERQLVFKPRFNKRSTYYRFDKDLHFQYWGSFEERVKDQGELVDTMSLQGSCFMATRAKYWELKLSDKDMAGKSGWGQQGVEVALKTWLSGGRLVVTKKTWYSHLFRTQGSDFGFPYSLSGSDIDFARKRSREIFQGDKWPLAIHPFNWIIEKFKPIPGWHEEDKGFNTVRGKNDKYSQKSGIVFYTDNQVSLSIASKVQKQLRKIGLPIVSASLKDMSHFGENIHLELQRGYLTMFKQQLAALERSKADIIYMCEHDVLYHPTHFAFTPPSKEIFYYNVNVWKINHATGHGVKVDIAQQVSGLCGYRHLLIEEYRRRVNRVEREGHFERGWGFEPGTKSIKRGGFSDLTAQNWNSKYPNLDIRSVHNVTGSRWKPEEYRNQQHTVGWKEADEFEGWEPAKTYFDILASI